MKITLLGTGTPKPLPNRASSGYLIEVGDDLIVMDQGAGSGQRLIESGAKQSEVSRAFFSHLHHDHCLDYPRLVLQRWDLGADKIPELKVFGPPPIGRMTELLFGPEGVFWPDIVGRTEHPASNEIFRVRGGTPPRPKPRPEVTEIQAGDVIEGKGWKVTVAEVPHLQPIMPCYAFRLEGDGASMCYSGDSGGVPESLVELARGVDVLIHMTYIMSGTEPHPLFRELTGSHLDVAEVAQRAGARTLVLTHMLEQIDQPGIRERVVSDIMNVFEGTVIWGEDLMEIPVEPLAPAKIE